MHYLYKFFLKKWLIDINLFYHHPQSFHITLYNNCNNQHICNIAVQKQGLRIVRVTAPPISASAVKDIDLRVMGYM